MTALLSEDGAEFSLNVAQFGTIGGAMSLAIATVNFFLSAARMGYSGYIPLHLRQNGWTPSDANKVVALVGLVSTIGVISLAYLSDPIQKGKWVIVLCLTITCVSVGLTITCVTVAMLGTTKGKEIWGLCAAIGA